MISLVAEVVATTVIVAISAHYMPCMTTTIGGIEGWTSEEEVVAVGIAGINGEVPEAVRPIKWAEEVGRCTEGLPLPVEQYVAQIQVAALPIHAIHIITARHTHQVIEIDFVGCLILLICQVQLIGHLICQEESLVTCLLVAHCLARSCYCQQCYQCHHYLFHNRIVLIVQHS